VGQVSEWVWFGLPKKEFDHHRLSCVFVTDSVANSTFTEGRRNLSEITQFDPKVLQKRVAETVQTQFGMLIPDDQFEKMVATHVKEFFESKIETGRAFTRTMFADARSELRVRHRAALDAAAAGDGPHVHEREQFADRLGSAFPLGELLVCCAVAHVVLGSVCGSA
jgi:hypothetical protein